MSARNSIGSLSSVSGRTDIKSIRSNRIDGSSKSNSDKNLIEIDFILEILKDKQPYTRENIQRIAEAVEILYKTKGTAEVELVDITGTPVIHKIDLTNQDPKESTKLRLALEWHSLQYMANEDPDHVRNIVRDSEKYYKRKLSIASIMTWYSAPLDCDEAALKNNMGGWKRDWDSCIYKKQLISYITTNKDALVRVDKVVCFALGSLMRLGSGHPGSSYIQHQAAMTIKEELDKIKLAVYEKEKSKVSAKTEGDRKPHGVKIWSQEPGYCATCRKYLRPMGIYPINDPYGWLKIDDKAFVISISPDVPGRQLITGISEDCGGPAALLCDRIKDDGMQYDQVMYDPSDYRDMNRPPTDPSAPWVMEYRNRCKVLELNDAEQHLGKNWDSQQAVQKWLREDNYRKIMFWGTELYIKTSSARPSASASRASTPKVQASQSARSSPEIIKPESSKSAKPRDSSLAVKPPKASSSSVEGSKTENIRRVGS